MIDYGVAINFLDYLAGTGITNNNNLIMIVNRKVYSIQEVLQKVAENPDLIQYTGGKQRYRF